MTSFNPLTSLKSKLYLLPIFLLFITLSSCNEEDNKKSDQTFTVTFSVGEGSAVASQRVSSGSKATAPSPAPTRSGYSFEGWYTSAGALFDFNTAITANITLSAKWTAITSTVTITYLDITGAVNTPLTPVAPTKAPAAATGTFRVKSGSTLPDGLTLNPTTGAISGTPTAVATSNVTIELVGTGSYTGTVETTVTITVNADRTAVNSIAYLDITGAVNTSLTPVAAPTLDPAAATGTFSVKSGTLPDGLTLNPSTGAISGTPTASATANVTIEFVGTGSYTGTVEDAVTITVNTDKTAISSIAYNAVSGAVGTMLTATPTKAPTAATGTFNVKSGTTALPDGLSLDENTGVISGTPTAVAMTDVTIEFVGTGSYTGTVETTVTITVDRATVNSITYSDPDITVAVNTALFFMEPTRAPAAATGTFRVKPGTTALPDGLDLIFSTGVIIGSPTATGTTMVTIEFVGTGNYTGTVETTVTITARGTAVNSITYPNITGDVNTYLVSMQPTRDPTTAAGFFRVKEGTTALPDGLSLDFKGVIIGTPTATGTTMVTIEFIGGSGYTGTVEDTFTITIN